MRYCLLGSIILGIIGLSVGHSLGRKAPRVTKDEVLRYFYSISGSKTISGQHNREPNSDPTKWTRVVEDITGVLPGLWGGDFLFSPDDVQHRGTMIDEAINQWNSGAVVALTFHSCPPTIGETCNWDSDGVLSHLEDYQWNELITDGAGLNQKWKERLDTIVPYLKKLQDAGVITIWRPIHEMNEGWSWWGGRPGENGSRKLYQITYDYLTNYHGLTSLIWTWCVKDVQMESIGEYWPGDNYVDVASLDMWMKNYPTDYDYQQMLNVANGKPIALAEVGAIPSPPVLNSQSKWIWFMIWAEYLKDPAFNSDDGVKATYYDPRVLHLGDIDFGGGSELPNLALNGPIRSSSQQDPEVGPENAVDGDLSTRWASDLNNEQWIYVDLGQPRIVRKIVLYWEDAFATSYQIQISPDGTDGSWVTIYEDYNGDGGIDTINLQAAVAARFVKVYSFEKATEYGYSLYEFEVYE